VLIVATGILILAFVALTLIGVTDARLGVERFKRELDASAGIGAMQFALASEEDALDEARFSASLLCLSRAQLQSVRNSPEPVSDESSLSVLVRPVRSKSHAAVS
jgi:hypothetical protein